jgi:hypothetical protein
LPAFDFCFEIFAKKTCLGGLDLQQQVLPDGEHVEATKLGVHLRQMPGKYFACGCRREEGGQRRLKVVDQVLQQEEVEFVFSKK